MNITELKKKFADSADFWIEQRIDDMAAKNPRLSVVSVYLKKGAKNWLSREKENISKYIDNAALFIADDHGEVSMDTFFDDMMNLFGTMEDMPYDYGMLRGTIGHGKIRIDIPNNILANILFGNNEAITITGEDLKEFKELFK